MACTASLSILSHVCMLGDEDSLHALDAIAFLGLFKQMQEVGWQVDMHSIVLCVRDYGWMPQLMRPLTVTMILRLISLDVAWLMCPSFIHWWIGRKSYV